MTPQVFLLSVSQVEHLVKVISEGIQVRMGERITVGIAQERARNISTALMVDINDWIAGAVRHSVVGTIEAAPEPVKTEITPAGSRYFFDIDDPPPVKERK